MKKNIHFVGLGNMGLPMATNLHNAGYNIHVFDLQSVQLVAAKKAGIAVLTEETIGINCDVFITMLPDGKSVNSVVIANDIAMRLNAKATIIDCSTTERNSAIELAEYAESNHLHFLDAPVSGGISGAQAGSLTFIVGGNGQVLTEHTDVFEVMGNKVFHVGVNGLGQVAKMCNNMMLAISMAGLSEALTLGYNNGIDVSVLSEVMKNASGCNWPLDCYNPWPHIMENAPASNGYQNGFKSHLMLKDLTLAEQAALDTQSPIHMGALARSLYAAHCQNQVSAESDFSSILNHYRKEET